MPQLRLMIGDGEAGVLRNALHGLRHGGSRYDVSMQHTQRQRQWLVQQGHSARWQAGGAHSGQQGWDAAVN
jgi:hypothetical protein